MTLISGRVRKHQSLGKEAGRDRLVRAAVKAFQDAFGKRLPSSEQALEASLEELRSEDGAAANVITAAVCTAGFDAFKDALLKAIGA
jgi:hypothetical protein